MEGKKNLDTYILDNKDYFISWTVRLRYFKVFMYV